MPIADQNNYDFIAFVNRSEKNNILKNMRHFDFIFTDRNIVLNFHDVAAK